MPYWSLFVLKTWPSNCVSNVDVTMAVALAIMLACPATTFLFFFFLFFKTNETSK